MALERDRYQYAIGCAPASDVISVVSQAGCAMAITNAATSAMPAASAATK